jgi:hypothetical protein
MRRFLASIPLLSVADRVCGAVSVVQTGDKYHATAGATMCLHNRARLPWPRRSAGLGTVIATAAVVAGVVLSTHAEQGSCSSNPIVCENALPGSPPAQWDISGSGDPTIQGFATEISVNKGETVHFKVDSAAPTFRIDIFRLGYYGGNGARKVGAMAPVAGRQQPACLADRATGLVDCGNWDVSADWAVPATAVSGIYLAKLTRTDTGGASHAVFVVRDEAANADLLFQTSDTTWQASNQYCGKSPCAGGLSGRVSKVSYNRPMTTRETSPEDWVFNAEYPMVRWLEANGYDVSYAAGVDTDRRGAAELLRHRVFLSVGHDAYWSGAQRANVEAARDGGTHVAFFSGQTMYWKTRWEPSLDETATPYRTLVCYKETLVGARQDPSTWTGRWRDGRVSPPGDGGGPENALTGTLPTVECCNSRLAITVPQAFADHPFWRHTRVATPAAGAVATLAAGTLGGVWDENADNGYRPAGLTALSSTTAGVSARLLDDGATYGAGLATHQLTLYRHAGGALVFGAGTAQWSWGLDGMHDRGGSLPDEAMQQATVNLLFDMGIEPAALQSGLVAGAAATSSLMAAAAVTPALGLDVNVSKDQLTARTSVATSTFSTAAGNELLLAFISAGNGFGTTTVRTVTGGGLTWQLVVRTNSQRGTAEIWRALATTTLTNVSVTATLSQSVTSSMTIVGFTGADTTGANGSGAIGATKSASASTGAPTATLTTTRDNTWVVGVGTDWTAATARTLGTLPPQTMVHQALATAATDTYWVQRTTAVTPLGGTSVTINDTAPTTDRWNLSLCEVRPALPTDATPPTVAMTAPADGTTVSGSAWVVSATALDDVGVLGVQFLLDGTSLGAEDTASPFSITWDTTTAANGQHTLAARARDAAGNTETAATVSVTVSNVDVTPPTVSMTAPAGGSTVFGRSVTVSATASDNLGIAGVQFTLDGAPLGAEASAGAGGLYATTWDSTTAPDGRHELAAVVRDAAGNTATATAVSVTVNNTSVLPPAVSVTVPAAGATVSGTATVVSATATSSAGIAGVQFKVDGVSIGTEDTVGPYSVTWNTSTGANGVHRLTAVARDVTGLVTTSAPITVTVNNTTGTVDLAVNGATTYQTIDGFMANANSAAWNGGQLKPALDLLLDQGVALFRVIIDNEDWEATNDNSDPAVFDWTYYNTVFTSQKFENLWSTMAYLNQKGVVNGLMLNFMGPTPAWMGSPKVTPGLEDEWVEMIAALVYYARVTRQLRFTLLGPANEVDWNGIEGPQIAPTQYALLLHKLAVKLDGLGLADIRFVGPDTASASSGVADYLPLLLADGTIMAKMAHFGFHNYAGVAGGADAAIKASVYADRGFWMTEAGFGNVGFDGVGLFIQQLKNGARSVGMWDAYDSVYNHMPNDAYPMIELNGATGTWAPNVHYFAYKPLFKFVWPGMLRVAATEAASNLAAVAFADQAGGRTTIVGYNTGSARTLRISLANLPVVGALKCYQSTWTSQFSSRADVSLVNGVASVPVDAGAVFALTSSNDSTPPSAPGDLVAAGSELRTALSWTPSTDNVGVAAYNIHRSTAPAAAPTAANRVAQTTGRAYVDAVAAGTFYYRVTAQDAAGNVSGASNEATAVVLPDSTPPVVIMTAPAGGAVVSGTAVTLSATASDNVAVAGLQFKTGGVYIGSEVSAIPYTVGWNSTTTANGPRTLTAVARDSAGNLASASVDVIVGNPPVISAVSPGAVTQNSVTVSWATNIPADSQVRYGTTTAYGLTTALDSNVVTAHAQTISGLLAGTPYHYQVLSKDAFGFLGISADALFVTAAPPDQTAPAVSVTAPAGGSTVAGTISVAATATDNVAVVGVQFKLDGAILGAEVTSGSGSSYSVTWDTSTATNGSHVLTAVARDAAGNNTTSAAVNVTVTNTTAVLATDVVAFGDQGTARTTVVTNTFSTKAANELLLAFVSADDLSAGNMVTGVSGGGLTWQLVVRTNTQRGTAEIWRAFATTTLANVSVTATLAQSVASSVTVVSFTGADPSGTAGSGAIGAVQSASAASGAPSATLTTTRAGSWVIGVGTDWDNPVARAVGPNQVIVHQYMPPVGDTYWVQRAATTTANSGTTVTINDTSPTSDRYNLSICEVLPKR